MKYILFAWCVGVASALVIRYGFSVPGDAACELGLTLGALGFLGAKIDSEQP